MEKQIKEMHLHAIKKQFEAVGFPADTIKRFLDEFVPDSGDRAAWRFEIGMQETKVKGYVHAGPDMPGGMYTLDYYELTLAKRRVRAKRVLPAVADAHGAAAVVPGAAVVPAPVGVPAAAVVPAAAPQLVPGPIPACVASNKFMCVPWSWIRLEEAVNLMQGRYVYRQPDADPVGEGYWMYLAAEEPIAGFHRLGFIRTRFDVGNYLAETGLGSWLGLNEWGRLVYNVESGARCGLVIGTGAGMRALKVEADPARRRLALYDLRGHELDVEKLMKRKQHSHAQTNTSARCVTAVAAQY